MPAVRIRNAAAASAPGRDRGSTPGSVIVCLRRALDQNHGRKLNEQEDPFGHERRRGEEHECRRRDRDDRD
jgi:hypothetical protein